MVGGRARSLRVGGLLKLTIAHWDISESLDSDFCLSLFPSVVYDTEELSTGWLSVRL
jgi:hypothetical protein